MTKKAQLFGPFWSIFFAVSTFFAGQLLALAVISPVLQFLTRGGGNPVDLLQNNVWMSFLFILILEFITLGIIYKLINTEFGSNFKTLGINKLKLNYLAYILVGALIYYIILVLVLIAVKALVPGLDVEQKQEIGFDTSTSGISLLPVFLSLVILPPIAEEIVARGFLFGGLRTKLPFVMSAIITSLLFALPHLSQASSGVLWVAGIDTFILSIILCYLREKSGSLWPSIGVHMIKNGIAFIVLFNIVDYIR